MPLVIRTREQRQLAAAATLIVLTTLALASCTDSPNAATPERNPPAAESSGGADEVVLSSDEMGAGGIVVDTPRTESRAVGLTASAVLQLDETRTARIGSVVDGAVVDIPVQVGMRVPAGARLASLHSHAVHESRAEYRRAQAEQRRAQSELAFAKEAEGRASRLLAAKAASRQEVERARTDRAAAAEALVIAESEVRRALEGLEHLGLSAEPEDQGKDAIAVTATLGGVVLERLVTPGSAITAGAPLFVVSDLARLWAVAEIDEALLPAIAVGDAADISVAAFPDRSFAGRIIAIGDTVNPDTRRVTVRIEVRNLDRLLKPQMFARVRLSTTSAEQVLLIPGTAVQKVQQQTVVFVEASEGRFVQRQVTIGDERDGLVEVREGLDARERLVVDGAFLIKSKFLQAGSAE